MVRQAGRDVPDTDDEGPPDVGWHTPGSCPGFAGGARGASGAAARFPEGARPLLVPVAAGSPRRGQGRRGARIRSPRPAAQPGPRPPPPMATPGAAAQGTTALPLRSRVPARLRAVTSFLWESTRAQIEKEMKETTAKLLPYGGRGSHDSRVLPAQTAPRRVGGVATAAGTGSGAHGAGGACSELPRRLAGLGTSTRAGVQSRRRETQRDPQTPN